MAESKHTKKGMSGNEWKKQRNKRLTHHLDLAKELHAREAKKATVMEQLADEGKLTLEMPKPKPKPTLLSKVKGLFKRGIK